MQLTNKLAGILSSPMQHFFGLPKVNQLIPSSIESFDMGNQHLTVGLERIQPVASPLSGRIYHRHQDPRQYFAAMGRTECDRIDYSSTSIRACFDVIVRRALLLRPDCESALESIAVMRGLSFDTLLSEIAGSLNDPTRIAEVIKGHLFLDDLPSIFKGCVAWFASNIEGWRVQAYLKAPKPLYWRLDYHRFSDKGYLRSGTTVKMFGVLRDYAVWVPDETVYAQIDKVGLQGHQARAALSLRILDRHLAEYNAYLKNQVYRVTVHQAVAGINGIEQVEIHSIEDCYGLQVAEAKKEEAIRNMWHLQFI